MTSAALAVPAAEQGPGARRGGGARAAALVALVALGAACRSEPPRATVTGDAGAPPGAASASGAPGMSRAGDHRWQRALGGDPLDLARLAEAVGAVGLLEGLDDGGGVAQAALLALPHAEDADLALRPLCERLVRSEPGSVEPVLQALLGIAGRPRTQREPLDPDGPRSCGDVLVRVAAEPARPRAERALAVSAARALAEKGQIDGARIPSELDPR